MAIKVFVVMLFSALVSSCSNTHQIQRHEDIGHIKLTSSDPIYVSVPRDGAYGSKIYNGSGQQVAQIAASSFQRWARVVRIGTSTQTFAQDLEAAKQMNAKYLVYMAILHWEDRNTEWSGKRDRVEVKVELVEVANGATIASTALTGRGKWMTFGGIHPQDLLPAPFDEYVTSLY